MDAFQRGSQLWLKISQGIVHQSYVKCVHIKRDHLSENQSFLQIPFLCFFVIYMNQRTKVSAFCELKNILKLFKRFVLCEETIKA